MFSGFPLQQRLRERVSVLRYTHVASIGFFFVLLLK